VTHGPQLSSQCGYSLITKPARANLDRWSAAPGHVSYLLYLMDSSYINLRSIDQTRETVSRRCDQRRQILRAARVGERGHLGDEAAAELEQAEDDVESSTTSSSRMTWLAAHVRYGCLSRSSCSTSRPARRRTRAACARRGVPAPYKQLEPRRLLCRPPHKHVQRPLLLFMSCLIDS
jgi:hypothetical protein